MRYRTRTEPRYQCGSCHMVSWYHSAMMPLRHGITVQQSHGTTDPCDPCGTPVPQYHCTTLPHYHTTMIPVPEYHSPLAPQLHGTSPSVPHHHTVPCAALPARRGPPCSYRASRPDAGSRYRADLKSQSVIDHLGATTVYLRVPRDTECPRRVPCPATCVRPDPPCAVPE